MNFGKHISKYASILTVSLLVGTGAAPALADDAGASQAAFGTDRAGDALPIGATSAAGGGSHKRTAGESQAAFGADRAGDALPIGARSAVTGPQERTAGRSQAAFGTDRAGDALPIGARSAVAGPQMQKVEREPVKAIN